MLKQAKEICPTTTMGKLLEGAIMVDVRNKSEVVEVTFDVPNYINIPLNELVDRINEIPKDKEIVMVCRSGERSLKTTYFLMNAGYENVYNMRDGIIKWASKGFPTKGDVSYIENRKASCCCSPTLKEMSSSCC